MIHALWLLVCFYFPYADFYLIVLVRVTIIKGELFSPFAIIYAWLYGSVLGSPLTLSICEKSGKDQVKTAAARTEQRQWQHKAFASKQPADVEYFSQLKQENKNKFGKCICYINYTLFNIIHYHLSVLVQYRTVNSWIQLTLGLSFLNSCVLY